LIVLPVSARKGFEEICESAAILFPAEQKFVFLSSPKMKNGL